MKIHKLTTPIGKAFYPKLQPDYKWDENGQYSCKIHIEDEGVFNEFAANVDKLVEKAYKEELVKQGKKKLSNSTRLLFVLLMMVITRSTQSR